MPKQFLPLIDHHSTYQQALMRVADAELFAPPVVMTASDFRFFARDQAEELGIEARIVLEPERRDSGPAIAAAAVLARQWDPQAVVLTLAADHVILDTDLFRSTCRAGREAALAGHIVTFGLKPSEPRTSYGYIRRGSPLAFDRVSAVAAFVEKPDPATALRGHGEDHPRSRRREPVPLVGYRQLGRRDAVSKHDRNANALYGPAIALDARDCLVHAEDRITAVVGVENLVVVTTPDAVLVLPRSRAEEVKELVSKLKAQGRPEASSHRRVYRPWGHYESVDMGERFQVKRIVVMPGCTLSLQRHLHRAEHWVVVRGTAAVTIGLEQKTMHENESTYIPIGAVHRLANHGKIPLELIEVQTGSYLGEDDIVRLNDVYGRAD